MKLGALGSPLVRLLLNGNLIEEFNLTGNEELLTFEYDPVWMRSSGVNELIFELPEARKFPNTKGHLRIYFEWVEFL